ncbi:hypothetical protein GUITHDRAFT_146143, partial [Guillardia theta CCMP2712]
MASLAMEANVQDALRSWHPQFPELFQEIINAVTRADGPYLDLQENKSVEGYHVAYQTSIGLALGPDAKNPNLRHCQVREVSAGGPSYIAGLRPGDLIVSINGQAIAVDTSVREILCASDRHGEEYVISFVRGESTLQCTVVRMPSRLVAQAEHMFNTMARHKADIASQTNHRELAITYQRMAEAQEMLISSHEGPKVDERAMQLREDAHLSRHMREIQRRVLDNLTHILRGISP